MRFGYFSTFQSLDKGVIERFGPTGFTASFLTTSTNFVGLSKGLLQNTVFFLITAFFVFLSFFTFGAVGFVNFMTQSFCVLVLAYLILSITSVKH
jgi:preprotein translocase subunit SecG